jgi:hypothetical protein
LRRAVARAADSRTAREVRDSILGDLSNFKGDEEQADDITVVVVRLRWPARADISATAAPGENNAPPPP